jgi:peptide/nickel transport system permease protein
MPTFSVGIAAVIVFALWLGWMPALGTTLAPAIILGVDTAGTLVKMLHEDMKEMETALWVRTARAKGLGRMRIVIAHLLPNAASVVLAMTGIILAGLVGGAITMEVVFGLPGIGTLTMQAMKGRDYPLIQAIILLLALGVVIANFVTDLLQRLIDPRLRELGRG